MVSALSSKTRVRVSALVSVRMSEPLHTSVGFLIISLLIQPPSFALTDYSDPGLEPQNSVWRGQALHRHRQCVHARVPGAGPRCLLAR